MTTNQNTVPSGESEVEMQQEQPLAKIPIEALYKLSRQEVGEWKSYAQELEDKVKVRLNLQFHKYIWGPDREGV